MKHNDQKHQCYAAVLKVKCRKHKACLETWSKGTLVLPWEYTSDKSATWRPKWIPFGVIMYDFLVLTPGVDEQTIIDVLTKRTYEQRREIAFAYERKTKKVESTRTADYPSFLTAPMRQWKGRTCVFRTWSRPWRQRCLALWNLWSSGWWRVPPSMTPQRSEGLSR